MSHGADFIERVDVETREVLASVLESPPQDASSSSIIILATAVVVV